MDQVRFDLKVIFGLYILTYGKNAALPIQLRTTATIGSISRHCQVLLGYYFHSGSILHLHTIPLLDAKYIM